MTNDELLAIGQQLRTVRQERGYSLDEVSTATKIRAKFLEGIENGEVDASLSEMQLRGFLRNYAAFLHLDLDAMLAAYRQALLDNQKRRSGIFKFNQPAAPPPEVPVIPIKPNATIKTPPHATPAVTQQTQPMPAVGGGRSGLLMGIVIGGFLVLAGVFVAYLLVVAVNDEGSSSDEPPPLMIDEGSGTPETSTLPPDPKGTVEILFTATPNPTATTGGVIINTPSQPDMTGADSISIAVSAIQRSWVKVTVDNQVQYEGILRPGTALQYQGQRSITLRTSNAGGIEVVINNQSLGVLGARGELYEQTFTLDALSLPTSVPPTSVPADITSGDNTTAPTADSSGADNTQTQPPEPTTQPDTTTSTQQSSEAPAGLNLPTPLPAPPVLATNVPVETPSTSP